MQRSYDADYSEKIRASMKNPSLILTDSITGSDMMGIISHMKFMIAMRLHALVYAANVDVPIFGIEYNPKVSGFMKYIGLDNYISITDFCLENNMEHIESCLAPEGKLSRERIDQLRDKSFSNAKIAVDLLNQTKEVVHGQNYGN